MRWSGLRRAGCTCAPTIQLPIDDACAVFHGTSGSSVQAGDLDSGTTGGTQARALEVYAKQAQNVEAERKATEIRLRAERRAGELMTALKRTPAAESGAMRGQPAGPATVARPATARLDVKFSGIDVPRPEYRESIDRAGIPERTAQRLLVPGSP